MRHAEGPGLRVLPADHEPHTPGTDPNAQVMALLVIDSPARFAALLRRARPRLPGEPEVPG
jgi:hypothetical protein